MKNLNGFGLVETIVALGIFLIMAVTGVSTVLHSYSINRLSEEETEAALLAQEGIEALMSIKKQDWSNISTGNYGLDNSGNVWSLGSTIESLGKFTRTITIEEVERNGMGEIVESGGTVDPSTFRSIVTVDWNFNDSRSNSVELVNYLTNFEKSIATVGDWSNPSEQSQLGFSGGQNGIKVQVIDDIAYLVRQNGNPDFIVIDISDPSSPSELASLNVSNTVRNIAISGDYAYLASSGDELLVIDISNPSSPSEIASLNPSGGSNGFGIFVSGNYAYLGRDGGGGGDQFVVANISNPSSPSLTASLGLSDDVNEIYVSGNYAYLATDIDSQELIVIDISNPASPSVAASLDLSGNANADTITGFSDTVFIGRSNDLLYSINVSNPLSPQERDDFDAQDNVRDLSLASDNSLLFVATDENNAEFQVVNLDDLDNLTLEGSADLNDGINGVAYANSVDRVIAASDDNSNEFLVLQPAP